jgi:hypothetical protein
MSIGLHSIYSRQIVGDGSKIARRAIQPLLAHVSVSKKFMGVSTVREDIM